MRSLTPVSHLRLGAGDLRFGGGREPERFEMAHLNLSAPSGDHGDRLRPVPALTDAAHSPDVPLAPHDGTYVLFCQETRNGRVWNAFGVSGRRSASRSGSSDKR
jgi:hypothetical protein